LLFLIGVDCFSGASRWFVSSGHKGKMSNAALQQEMENTLAEYNKCSEELAEALNLARSVGQLTPELMNKIRDTNNSCNELLERYLFAYRAYYVQ
jgi:hypothetical protein